MPAIIKKLNSGIFLMALSLMINPLGFCFNDYYQNDRNLGNADNDKIAYVGNEQGGKKEIPFSALTTESAFISQAKISEGTKETVTGLKNVGFSTEVIVKTLKNGNKNAIEISIACLNVNISGEEIYNALLNAGFSQATADEAVPHVLRNDKQLNNNQNLQTNINSSGSNGVVLGISDPAQKTQANVNALITNDALLENTIVALKQANVSTPQIINVLRDMGVCAEKIIEVLGKDVDKGSGAIFKGLGEWASFQNSRFSRSEQANARKSELINSMLASGFKVEEIVKGFVDSAEGKNVMQQGKIIRVTVADIANAGIKFEVIIAALKDLGFSVQVISDALTGKSDSFIDKIKSGVLFNGEKQEVAVKVLNNLVNSGTLGSAVQQVEKEGYKPAVIADALTLLGVSSAQISEVLNKNALN